MPSAQQLLAGGPYDLPQPDKSRLLLGHLEQLTRSHFERCAPYRHVIDNAFGGLPSRYDALEQIPWLPVSLFKTQELCSVPAEEVLKVLHSSGTTGQRPSRVFLDRPTAAFQQRVLVTLLQHFLGKQRLPMVVVDKPSVITDRTTFSARGAGVQGLLQFGRQPHYALREDMSLDVPALAEYLQRHESQRILFFGFTYLVWKHLVEPLRAAGQCLDAQQGILIHSGGWKKLQQQSVDRETYNAAVEKTLGIPQCINFYGMAEQVGSVFLENPLGFLHAPVFADVIVRDPLTLRPLPEGQVGLLQVLSVCPGSYPGHSILTEDLGRIAGCDDPRIAMRGRFFEIVGRAPKAEVRGCSDTYAMEAAR